MNVRETARRMRPYLDAYDIAAFGVDVDGVLLKTHSVFKRKMNEWTHAVVADVPGLPFKVLRRHLKEANWRMHQQTGVHTSRWGTVVAEVARLAGGGTGTSQAITDPRHLDIFADIYRTLPPWEPGARTMLRAMRATGRPIIFNTHADLGVSLIKWGVLRWYGDGMHIVRDSEHEKGMPSWLTAADMAHTRPGRMMGVEDNIHNLWDMHEAGYRLLAFITGQWGSQIANGRTVPEHALVVGGGIRNLDQAMTRLTL